MENVWVLTAKTERLVRDLCCGFCGGGLVKDRDDLRLYWFYQERETHEGRCLSCPLPVGAQIATFQPLGQNVEGRWEPGPGWTYETAPLQEEEQ